MKIAYVFCGGGVRVSNSSHQVSIMPAEVCNVHERKLVYDIFKKNCLHYPSEICF